VAARGQAGYSLVTPTEGDSWAARIRIRCSWCRRATPARARTGTRRRIGLLGGQPAAGTPSPQQSQYASGTTRLHWSPNAEADLAAYHVYRGSSPSFTPSSANLVGAVSDTGFVDVRERPTGTSSPRSTCTATRAASPRAARRYHGRGRHGARRLRARWRLAEPVARRTARRVVRAELSAPATLELLDVAGRRVAARDVGALGAGARLRTGHGRAAWRRALPRSRLTSGR